MAEQLSKCLEEEEVPNWMIEGRTVLIMKDKNKGNSANNYRPITYPPLMWKLLTGLIADEIYEYLGKMICCHKNRKVGERNVEELLTSCILTRWY